MNDSNPTNSHTNHTDLDSAHRSLLVAQRALDRLEDFFATGDKDVRRNAALVAVMISDAITYMDPLIDADDVMNHLLADAPEAAPGPLATATLAKPEGPTDTCENEATLFVNVWPGHEDGFSYGVCEDHEVAACEYAGYHHQGFWEYEETVSENTNGRDCCW